MTSEPGAPDDPAAMVPGARPIEQLLPVVYQELRAIARHSRARISGGETLATTALIHEAYLRLARSNAFNSHGHFLSVASIAMRQILVDRARRQFADKRGGGVQNLEFDEVHDFVVEDEKLVLDVNEALERLAEVDPRLAQVVECRFFSGYSEAETAEAIGISVRSVRRDWAAARAWLRKEMAA